MATGDNTNLGLETLAAYALGELDADRTAGIEAQARSSASVRQVIEKVRMAVEAMRSDDTVMPRRELVDRVKAAVLPDSRPSLAEWLAQLGRAAAEVVFDSRGEVAMAGFRGGSSISHQLAFSTPGADIDLQLLGPESARDAEWTIRGQVSALDSAAPPRACVALIDHDSRRFLAAADADERGQFELRAPSGCYDLVLKIDGKYVTVPQLIVN